MENVQYKLPRFCFTKSPLQNLKGIIPSHIRRLKPTANKVVSLQDCAVGISVLISNI